jgi:hypothetical protein
MLQQPRLGCGRTIERGVNNFHYAFDVLADIIIPDAKDSVTFSFKPSRPLLVAPSIFLFAVLRTIDFNDEASGGAGKIDDEFSDWHLAAKVSTAHFKLAQTTPEIQFSIGRILA